MQEDERVCVTARVHFALASAMVAVTLLGRSFFGMISAPDVIADQRRLSEMGFE